MDQKGAINSESSQGSPETPPTFEVVKRNLTLATDERG